MPVILYFKKRFQKAPIALHLRAAHRSHPNRRYSRDRERRMMRVSFDKIEGYRSGLTDRPPFHYIKLRFGIFGVVNGAE